MRILIAEDDGQQGRELTEELEEAFPGVKVELVISELDFYNRIDDDTLPLPDAVIVDIMLRWTVPSPVIVERPPHVKAEGFYKAGFRCERKLAEREATKAIPVILYTVLESSDVKKETENLRPNVKFLKKAVNSKQLVQRLRDSLNAHREKAVRTPFVLEGYAGAKSVSLGGSFNNWGRMHTMVREGDRWVCHVNLKPDVYSYKYVVDGKWITDPANPNTEYDTNGNLNSVKEVKSG